MAKTRSKGTALLMEISSVYTPIPQVISIDVSGEKGESYDSTALDGGTHKTKASTGFVEAPSIKAELFWDPTDTTHIAFQTWVRTPAPKNFKITYADSGPTSEVYNGVVGGFDKKVALADGLKKTIEIETSGSPS